MKNNIVSIIFYTAFLFLQGTKTNGKIPFFEKFSNYKLCKEKQTGGG